MPNQVFFTFILLFVLSVVASATDNVDDDWSFIVLADWHGGETFSHSPVNDTLSSNTAYYEQIEVLQHINRTYGGELVLLPGDLNDGKWYTKSFRKKLRSELNLTKLSIDEAVSIGGQNCYSTVKRLFSEAGYEKIIVSVGDHELGGDAWPDGSPKTDAVPTYRSAFASVMNKEENEFIYSESIGNATSQPIGTPYVNTSYAHVHKNILFVTVDAFHDMGSNFYDRQNGLGGSGTISCTVVGEHLAWFENVLKEARKNPSIDHIFVQAHLPVIQPVRKINSSGQFIDNGTDSDFWKVMQKYEVDIYFGGEVHANTVTKDPESNLIQVISRANRLSNFLKVDVSKNRLTLSSFNEVGSKWKWNKNYTKYGELVIDKNGTNTTFNSSGSLELFDKTAGPLIWLKFKANDTYPFQERQILGLKHNQYKSVLWGNSINISDVVSSTGMVNHGVFGQQYDAQIANIAINESQSGAIFQQNARLAFGSMGPMAGGDIISSSLYFKTSSAGKVILIFYGDSWGLTPSKNIFLLMLKKGQPYLYVDERKFLTPMQNIWLNDNRWHHIIISMPRKNCLFSEITMYIDNRIMATRLRGKDDNVFYTLSGYLSLGGWGYSSEEYANAEFQSMRNMKDFEGEMDDFQLWFDKVLDPSYFLGSGPPEYNALRTSKEMSVTNKIIIISCLTAAGVVFGVASVLQKFTRYRVSRLFSRK